MLSSELLHTKDSAPLDPGKRDTGLINVLRRYGNVTTQMTPLPDLEAEHLREKARKELLGLLEGVSKANTPPLVGMRVLKRNLRSAARRTS